LRISGNAPPTSPQNPTPAAASGIEYTVAVGLIVPHPARLVVGPVYKRLPPVGVLLIGKKRCTPDGYVVILLQFGGR